MIGRNSPTLIPSWRANWMDFWQIRTRTVSYENVVGILTIECFCSGLRWLRFRGISVEVFVEYFLTVCFQFQRSDDMMIPVFLLPVSAQSPDIFFDFFIWSISAYSPEGLLFHHLTDHAIGQYHSRITIFKSQLETQYDKISFPEPMQGQERSGDNHRVHHLLVA